ncbi:Gp15 family bacteriophage protein [Streptococcus pluranimalium]|uniref:Gp15 family bacteriophage protein n=1 Tax=Streptococcus pluranimalium TaxID=82348 RepID=UPI003F6949C0
MLDLSRKLTDELIIGDETYQLNLCFDNILKLFAMWRDEEVPEMVKPHFALRMLVGLDFENSILSQISVEEAMAVFVKIFEEHIQLKETKNISVEYDLAGNVMKRSQSEDGKQEPSYNLELDGDYIFASFLQAYSIDLFEVQGELHWKKFNALLAGLPEGTKFVEVIKIRKYKPQKGESQEYISEMRRLQKEYALPGQIVEEDDEELNEFEN